LIHRFGLLYSKGLLYLSDCKFSIEVKNTIDLQQKILIDLIKQPNIDDIEPKLLKMKAVHRIFNYNTHTGFMRKVYAQLNNMQQKMDWQQIDSMIATSEQYVADLDEIEEIDRMAKKDGQFIIVFARHPLSMQALDGVYTGKFRVNAILTLENKVRMYIKWAKQTSMQ
jgi:hypothetical protein